MYYLELLRVRRVFVWYAAILVVVELLVLYGTFVGNHANFDSQVTDGGTTRHVHEHGLTAVTEHASIPMGAVLAACGFFALIFGTFLAASFNRTSQHAHFSFVRPVSRFGMAAQVAGVDIASIIVAQFFAIAMVFATCFLAGGILHQAIHIRWDDNWFAQGMLGLGCALMWYAVFQALSAWTPERRGSGVFVGIGVAIMVTAPQLVHATIFGPIFVDVFKAILFIDPIAYFSSVHVDDAGDATIGAYFSSAVPIRAAIVWTLAAVAIVLASIEWKRVEM